jgi:hypothetical protein
MVTPRCICVNWALIYTVWSVNLVLQYMVARVQF